MGLISPCIVLIGRYTMNAYPSWFAETKPLS